MEITNIFSSKISNKDISELKSIDEILVKLESGGFPDEIILQELESISQNILKIERGVCEEDEVCLEFIKVLNKEVSKIYGDISGEEAMKVVVKVFKINNNVEELELENIPRLVMVNFKKNMELNNMISKVEILEEESGYTMGGLHREENGEIREYFS